MQRIAILANECLVAQKQGNRTLKVTLEQDRRRTFRLASTRNLRPSTRFRKPLRKTYLIKRLTENFSERNGISLATLLLITNLLTARQRKQVVCRVANSNFSK